MRNEVHITLIRWRWLVTPTNAPRLRAASGSGCEACEVSAVRFWLSVPFLQRHAPSLPKRRPAEPSRGSAPQTPRLRPFHEVSPVQGEPCSLLCIGMDDPSTGKRVEDAVIDFVHLSCPALDEPCRIAHGYLRMSRLDYSGRHPCSCPSFSNRCISHAAGYAVRQFHDRA